MRLLITGGCGFIGSAVIRHALEGGHEVLNVDALTYAGYLGNLSDVEANAHYSFSQTDICQADGLREVIEGFQPDAVMHLAAESHVDNSISGPGIFVQTNIVGTFNLLEACRHYWQQKGKPSHFRFHHVSTDEVFGSLGPEGKFKETTPYSPNSPYSASKAASDHFVRAWHETYDLPVVLTNCSNNYGPRQFPEKLLPLIILNAAAGKPLPVYGKGENIRDWLHVDDHATALLVALERGEVGRSYNIGGECEVRNIDLVRKVCEILDQKRPNGAPHSNLITFVTDRPGHDMRYAIDNSRVKNELHWTPRIGLDEGLNDTIDWYLNNQAWLDGLTNRKTSAG